MCAGGKEPPARSIKRFSELFEVLKTVSSLAKEFFDKLKMNRQSCRFIFYGLGRIREVPEECLPAFSLDRIDCKRITFYSKCLNLNCKFEHSADLQ